MRLRQSQTFAERLLEEQGSSLGGLGSTAEVELRVTRAAAYVRDAMEGRFSGSQWAEATTESVRLKLLFHRVKPVRMVVVALFVGISFVEQPSWCYGTPQCTYERLSHAKAVVPMSGLPVLPVHVTQLIELACLLFMCGELYAKFRYRGKAVFWSYGWYYLQILIIIVDFAGVGLSWANPTGLTLVNPFTRPVLFIVMHRSIRKSWIMLGRILPSFADSAALMLLAMFFYATAGTILFEGTEEGAQIFPSIWMGVLNLNILVTTANFPDVMMPAYSRNWLYSLFFISYLLFAFYFVMNLILATIYNKYKEEVELDLLKCSEQRENALTVAFHLLDVHGTDHVEIPICVLLLKEMERPAFSLFNYTTSVHELERTRTLLDKLTKAHGMTGLRGVTRPYFGKLVHSIAEEVQGNAGRGRGGSAAAVALGLQRIDQGFLVRRHPWTLECGRRWLGPAVASVRFEHFFSAVVCLSTLNLAVQADYFTKCYLEADKHSHHGASGAAGHHGGSSGSMSDGAGAALLLVDLNGNYGYANAGGGGGGGGGGGEDGGRPAGEGEERVPNELEPCESWWWAWSEGFFSCLYLVELVLKVGVYSLRGYWSSHANRYDCVITLATVAGQVFLVAYGDPEGIDIQRFSGGGGGGTNSSGAAEADPTGGAWGFWLRVILLVRLGRVLRLTTTIRRFEMIFGTLIRLIPGFTALFLMMFTMMYLFAVVGIQLFGGLVRRDNLLLLPNSTNPDVQAFTTSGDVGYWANNFNDLPSALVTLFELMVVNNWFVIMNGIAAAYGSPWARLYFIAFWVVAVLAVMNLVIAFVLEAFFEREEELKATETAAAAAAAAAVAASTVGSLTTSPEAEGLSGATSAWEPEWSVGSHRSGSCRGGR